MISHFRHLRTCSNQLSNTRRQLSSFISIIPIQSNVNHEVTRKMSLSVICYTGHSKEKFLLASNLRHVTKQICALQSFSTSSRFNDSQQSVPETTYPTLKLTINLDDENVIIVHDLPKEVSFKDLDTYFSRYGDIDYSKNKFEIIDGSLIACIAFKSRWFRNPVAKVLNGGPHYVNYSIIGDTNDLARWEQWKKEQRKLKRFLAPPRDDLTLVLGILPPSTTPDSVKKLFSKIGQVTHMRVGYVKAKNGMTNKYGYVTFATKEQLTKALENQPYFLDGESLSVKPNSHRSDFRCQD
ncbi:RNA recognition motif domain-containing protein [Ditylenchus destructor]|nr:RNA recognition motif domain-containing protein [Ditylenchus destructor]